MRFADYRCNDCGEVSELIMRADSDIRCEHCGSQNVARVFSGVSVKASSSRSAGTSSSCSGSCNSCSGCG